METNNREKGQGMAVPVAIVAAGAVVALTIFYAYGVNIGTRLTPLGGATALYCPASLKKASTTSLR